MNRSLYWRYQNYLGKYVVAKKLHLIMFANKPLEPLDLLLIKKNNTYYFYCFNKKNVHKFCFAYFSIGFLNFDPLQQKFVCEIWTANSCSYRESAYGLRSCGQQESNLDHQQYNNQSLARHLAIYPNWTGWPTLFQLHIWLEMEHYFLILSLDFGSIS